MKSWFLRYTHLFSLVFLHDFILTGGYFWDTNCGMNFEDQLNYFKFYVMLRSSDDLRGQNLRSKKVNRVLIEVYFGGALQVGVANVGFKMYACHEETSCIIILSCFYGAIFNSLAVISKWLQFSTPFFHGVAKSKCGSSETKWCIEKGEDSMNPIIIVSRLQECILIDHKISGHLVKGQAQGKQK